MEENLREEAEQICSSVVGVATSKAVRKRWDEEDQDAE
jgi:hypothetical protein